MFLEPVILIAGATATGKSNLAVALAKKINGYVINGDSMQVYRDLSIITACPSNTEQQQIKHFLYGYLNGDQVCSAGKWAGDVVNVINENLGIPLICGGSGLYLHSIVDGLSTIPDVETSIRIKARDLIKNTDRQVFYQDLLKLDPLVENKININDTQRLTRAWELKQATGKSMFFWQNQPRKQLFNKKILILLRTDKNYLSKIILERLEQMIRQGVIDEIENLQRAHYDSSLPIMKVIGVKQFSDYLNNHATLEDAMLDIHNKTMQLVKRQNTWFNKYFSYDYVFDYHDNCSVDYIAECVTNSITKI